jgi:hypothetical protein
MVFCSVMPALLPLAAAGTPRSLPHIVAASFLPCLHCVVSPPPVSLTLSQRSPALQW